MTLTSIRISLRAKPGLDRLQARFSKREGRQIPKHEVLDRLVDQALEDDAIPILRAPKYPLSEKAIRRILAAPWDWGVETREEDIDKILYGDEE